MADHVVVPTEACRYPSAPCGQNYNDPSPCYGCLGDGTRAVLDQAIAVEQGAIDGTWGYSESDNAFMPGEGRYYREVES